MTFEASGCADDQFAVTDALLRFAEGADAGDEGLLVSAFTTEAEVDFEACGRTLGAGADWMLVGPDGVLRMDVRIQLSTDDGAILCARYRGIGEPNERMRAAMEHDGPTRFQDQRIRTCWDLECGDPRYAWVNRCLLVGEARLRPAGENQPGFEHHVYRLA